MLVPIALFAYFYDLPDWVSTIYSGHLLGLLAAAVALFVLGLWLKRGIVGAYLEMSNGSNVLGLMFLSAAILSYVYGSWYGPTSWLHFQSLLLLTASYGLFRLDVRFMRLTAPLLAMFAFVLPFPFSVPVTVPFSDTLLKQLHFPLYVPIVFVVLFAFYVGARPRAMLLPALVAAVGALYWLYPSLMLLAFAPLACFVVLIPGRLRRLLGLPSGGVQPCALHDQPDTLVRGFCAMCGRKRTSIRQGHLGAIGLVVVLLTLYALVVTQIPILSLDSGVPSSTVYSSTGITRAQIPPTPSGWLVNSSTALIQKGDVYAVKQVYVPSYHPETENYTLYYELSSTETVISNSWQGIPGWNQSSTTSSVLPLGGRIITYVSPHVVRLVFVGTTHMYFLSGTTFEPLSVGYSVTREFRGTNVANATSVFTSELQALFQSGIKSEGYYSAWTGYFSRVSQTATAIEGLLGVISTAGLILWGTYRVELSDTKLDSFVKGASEIGEEDYSLLSKQLEASRSSRTGNEIAAMAGVDTEDTRMLGRIHRSLQELERNGLVKTTLVERGSDPVLVWELPV